MFGNWSEYHATTTIQTTPDLDTLGKVAIGKIAQECLFEMLVGLEIDG